MYQVLIVDDEEIVCRGMAQFVKWEKCGFEVAGIAASVDEALRMLKKMSIDVVFTDIRMPEKSGDRSIERSAGTVSRCKNGCVKWV